MKPRSRRSSSQPSATGDPATLFFFPCSVRSANAVANASTPGPSPQKRRLGPRTGPPGGGGGNGSAMEPANGAAAAAGRGGAGPSGEPELPEPMERQRALLARLAELGAVPEGLAGPGLLSSFLNLRG